MLSHFKLLVCVLVFVFSGTLFVDGQSSGPTPTPKPEKPPKVDKKTTKPAGSEAMKTFTADQIAESALFVYSGGLGREGLKQIRKTTIERGKMAITNPDGTIDQANYEKRSQRGESLDKEKIRFDQEFPTQKFALIYNEAKVVGVFNDSVFTPRDDASRAFTNQIWHGIEALLRYKENGSALALGSPEKYMGVDLYTLDLTDKQEQKTRYFISAKSLRVIWLDYSDGGVKYVRKFNDYRYAQGTLVPYRSVLTAGGKQVEESTVMTVSYGQKVTDDTFLTS